MKFAVLLCLAACAFGEDLPPYTALASFFHTVEQRSRLTETLPPDTFVPPTVQAALNFTDAEVQALNAIAKAYVQRASSLRAPTSELVFQARLELADTGKESEAFKQQIKAMDAGLAAALAQATRELRTALGDERYRKFDAWFQAGGATGCWVGPCSAVPRR